MLGGRGFRVSISVALTVHGLPGMFVPRQMVLFVVLFGDTMGMGRAVL
jgi:hypothetical protein